MSLFCCAFFEGAGCVEGGEQSRINKYMDLVPKQPNLCLNQTRVTLSASVLPRDLRLVEGQPPEFEKKDHVFNPKNHKETQ